jgi:hypothetical protein
MSTLYVQRSPSVAIAQSLMAFPTAKTTIPLARTRPGAGPVNNPSTAIAAKTAGYAHRIHE